ncbi:MAG: UDP-N-acetylmuramate dehydrogenase [Patescibacteria group bacterium]
MSLTVLEHVSLADWVSLKTGGPAHYFIEVTTIEALQEAVAFSNEKQLPFYVLGGGTNMLVSDAGYEGVIIKMNISGRAYNKVNDTSVALVVGAGESFDAVIEEVTSQSLWGLENLSHIPGTVGATPVQNVGAYGVEVSDIISHVTVYDVASKKIVELTKDECLFSYRHSLFKENKNYIIISVTFILSLVPTPKLSYADLQSLTKEEQTPQRIREAVITIRSAKFPDWNVVGTAGSFFKNPIISPAQAKELIAKYPDIPTYMSEGGLVKVSLGYILDKICGLKGFTIGCVRLYEKQALVLVATKPSNTNDIKNFKKIISEKVFEKTFIQIEQEVTEI